MEEGFCMGRFLAFFSLLSFSFSLLGRIPFDYSMYNDQKKRSCDYETYEKCYSLDEIVEKLKTNNYDVRDKLQSLIQARQNIRVKLGRLFPSFHMSLGISAGLADFTAIPSLLGFLFPHNWFNWKESKLFYLAQRHSYKALLVNEIVTGVELYYILHQEFVETEIYMHYYRLMDEIEKFLVSEMDKSYSKITKYHLRRIKALKHKGKIKATFLQNEFKDTFPLIANLMAMPIDSRWDKSTIVLQKLPNLDKYEKKDQNAFYEKVIELSPEVKTIDYLLLASNYTKKSRIFSFLSPGAGADDGFGVGYFSQIKIAQSKKKQLEIRREKAKSLLKVRIHALLLNHNAAIDTYREAILGRGNAKNLLDDFFSDYEETKFFDVEMLIDILDLALQFDLNRNFSQHYFFANKSKIDRMLFQGPFFSSIDKLIPKKKKLDGLSSWSKRREDKKIAKAIREKRLKIEE